MYRVRRGDWRAPVVLGLAAFIASPTVTAYSDITSLLSGSETGHVRWNAHLTTTPAGSLQSAEMSFDEPILIDSTATAAGITLANGRRVTFQGAIGADEKTPDEDRVTRSQKRGRVTTLVPVQPPSAFSAGSLADKQASLLSPVETPARDMAFVTSRIDGKEMKIATAFYRRGSPALAAGVPKMLASLVNNPRPDILATAYADSTPDYSRHSPFASILHEEDRQGRFIPPSPNGDPNHAWVATALPPSAFTAAQQHCLAAGVYFEARGESVKGQAAVAQVILNRVRNPAYPDTICGVVYQNDTWRNRCQFSFACDGLPETVRSTAHWKVANQVAMAVTAGRIWLKDVGSSTHYHAVYAHPRWARDMKKVDRIGLHVFYETRNGGWD